MSKYVRLLFAGVVIAGCLGVGVAGASANELSVSGRNFRAVWTSFEVEAASSTVRCPVTLEGSFHSTLLAKVANALVGHVSRASVATGSCTGGTLAALGETLPWHVEYASFSGTLPNITSVGLRSVGASFLATISGISCLARTTEAAPARFAANISSGTVTGLQALSEAGIPLAGGFLCEFAGSAHLAGTATVTALGSTASIGLTLIGATASVTKDPAEGTRIPVYITNTTTGGEFPITISGIALQGNEPEKFSIDDTRERCRGKTISVRVSCKIFVVENGRGGSAVVRVTSPQVTPNLLPVP